MSTPLPSDTAAIVLAAGASIRFREAGGGPSKLTVDLDGRPVVVRAIESAVGAGFTEVVVVQGSEDLVNCLTSNSLLDEVTLLHNEGWVLGLAASLRCALDYLDRSGYGAAVVGLGDQPTIPTSAWQAVASSDAALGIATYNGERGHPVRLDRSIWSQLPMEGEVGARSLSISRPELVGEIPCDGDPTDVDTPADLQRF